MSTPPRAIVVVGAGAAGLTAAETLRESGFDGRLTLIGAEPHLPYDRPPLSKQILLGDWEPDRLALRAPDAWQGLGLDLRLGTPAAGLDTARRVVRLADGAEVGYEGLVIATGVGARGLGAVERFTGVRYLRTLEDALELREQLPAARHTVVVGAGFLGIEIASAARALGGEVTVVDPLPYPMVRQFGPALGERVRTACEARGIVFRLGAGVRGVGAGPGGRRAVHLDDGSVLATDLVVAAVGAEPATGWLAGSGLDLSGGVRCDARCRAAEGVYVAGDVASNLDPATGAHHRFEHRMNATEQGRCAALNLLGAGQDFTPSHFFWTEAGDVRIQAVGTFPAGGDLGFTDGSFDDRRFVATHSVNGVVTGVLGWNSARQFTRARRLLNAGPTAAGKLPEPSGAGRP